MAGASATVKGSVLAGYEPTSLHMLNQSQCISMPNISDVDAFGETVGAMAKLGVEQRGQDETMGIL